MAHPKRKISNQRKRKRRTNQKLVIPVLSTCPTTGIKHRPHEAYRKDGKLYYRGKLLMDAFSA